MDEQYLKRRRRALLAGIPRKHRSSADRIIDEILFIEDRLAAARDAIGDASVAIYYDNGGGQSGLRENPAFVGYEKLLKSYHEELGALDALREDDDALFSWNR